MSAQAVGTLWEVDVWKPHLQRSIDLFGGPMTDTDRDDAVYNSFVCLPVPVLQIPYDLGVPTLELGWVGESLSRLEGAGRVRSVTVSDARYYMRVSPIVQAADRA